MSSDHIFTLHVVRHQGVLPAYLWLNLGSLLDFEKLENYYELKEIYERHLELPDVRLDVLLLGDHRDVVVLALSLGQQLEPAPGALALSELGDTETGKMLRETINEMFGNLSAPMKSFLEVLSQSQISMNTLLSLSSCLRSLGRVICV